MDGGVEHCELRGQAGSWTELSRVSGDATSLAVGGVLLGATASFPLTVTLLAIGPLLAVVIVATSFPDTHGVELETISGGDAAA